jgi:hypothetical protein
MHPLHAEVKGGDPDDQMICAATEVTPTAARATAKTANVGAAAATARATAVMISVALISVRRSRRSPTGKKNAGPRT